jgi:hypothetical protein
MEYVISDAQKRRVEVTFVGHYSGDMNKFSNDIKANARAAKAGGRYFDILSDYRQTHVLPQQLLAESTELIQWCVDNGVRKSASVVSSILLKMQLERMTPDEGFKVFLSRDEAIAWLDE